MPQEFDPSQPFQRVAAGGFDPSQPFTRGPVTPSQFGDGSMVRPRQRSLGERFTDVVTDAARRNPVIAMARAAMDARPVWRDGNLLPEWEDRNLTVRDPETGRDLNYSSIGQQMRADERERRTTYQQRSDADGWRQAQGGLPGQVAAGATNLTGALVGAMADPLNLISPGRTALGRIAGGVAVNAAGDAVTQAADIGAGLQDNYSPVQTLVAGGLGGLIQGGFEVAPHVPGAVQRGGQWIADRAAPIVRPAVERAREAMQPRRPMTGAAVDAAFPDAPDAAPSSVRMTARTDLPPAFQNPVPSFDGAAVDATPAPAQTQPRQASSPPRADQSRSFISPVEGRVSSGFGRRRAPTAGASSNHGGMDFAVPEGTPVRAAADGEVIFAGEQGGYGNRVVVRHGDGSQTTYSHLSGMDVSPGDRVSSGQPIARSGGRRGAAGSGTSTGPHLHFEVIRNGQKVDPSSVIGSDGPPLAALEPGSPTARVSKADPLGPQPRPEEFREQYARAREAAPEGQGLDGLGIRTSDGFDPAQPFQRVADEQTARVAQEPAAAPRQEPQGFHPDQPFERVAAADAAPAARFDPAQPFERAPAVPERLAVDLGNYADRIGEPLPSSGQTVGGLREAPRPTGVSRADGAVFSGKTVSDLAADLRQALGLTHRQGRVGMKQALGTYNTQSGVVRTKAVDELDVLAHEATHALEFERQGPALRAALNAHATELKRLDYDPSQARREEGFAEWGRWYLTNPDHARRVAPNFTRAFEETMRQDAPDVLAGMQAVQEGYQNLLNSASIDTAKGSIAYTGNKGPIRNLVDEVRRRGPGSTARRLMDDLYTAVVDDLHPVSVAVRKLGEIYAENTGRKLELKRANDPYALARLSREAYAAGHSDLMNGVTPYQGLDAEGPSLADALETAGLDRDRTGKFKPDATREFDVYLIARRMAEEEWPRYQRGELPNPPDRNTIEFHQQIIEDAERAHPSWRDASEQVYGFLDNLWRKEFEAGLITREAYESGRAKVSYVPLMRDMSDKGPGRAGKPRGAMQFAGGVKAFEGSSRDIISPLSSIMRRAYELNAIVKRNDVMKALDDLAQAAGRGAGAIVERLPAKEIEAVTINAADALAKAADELGLSGRDLSTMQKFADDAAAQDATLQVFRQSEFSPRKGEAVVFVWREGKKTPLLLPDGEFGQQMFESLAGMNRDLRNVAVDIMATGTQALRYGVTLSPEFQGANILRDSLATWINTDIGFVPGLDTIRGGAAELAQGKTAQRYAMAGGMRGGANTAATSKPFPRTDAEAEAQLQHLRRKGWKVKRFASWRGLAELTDLSETSTRLGVFKRGFDKAKREGLSDYEALIESGFTSRDYLDFGRRGSKMLTASRLVTFLNAALQGLDKSGRVLTAGGNLKALLTPLSRETRTPAERAALGHAYKAWAKVSMLGALGLGLRMLYADDLEYQEIGDRLRATHWILRANGQWVFVPKPFELATISNILERGYEGTVLKDPTAGERLLSDFRHTIAPPSEIPALSVPFHLASNRDYLGRPIVPDHLKGTVDPERQFTAYSSDLGKLIGRTFGLSPAQVDYVVTGFGGSLGRYALQGSNLIGEAVTGRPRTAAGPEDWFLSRRFVRDPSRGATSQSEFWDNVSRDGGDMTRAEGTFRSLMKEAKDAEAVRYINGLTPQERGFVLAKVFSEDGSSRLHPMIRAQNAVSVYGDFRTALREGEIRGADGQPLPLTPQERLRIDSALGDLAMAEMRNALIETGVRGWAQKDRMDSVEIAARIGQARPDVARELQGWLARSRVATVFHPAALAQQQQAWATFAPNLTGPSDPARLTAAMQRERLASGDRLDRYREAQRFVGGQGTQAPRLSMTGPQPRQPAATAGLMTGSRP